MADRVDPVEFIQAHRSPLLTGLAGLFLLGIGILAAVVVSLNQKSPEVEVIPATDRTEEEIVVDVAGAVERPGVYRLPAGSRVEAALVAAGGLSASADRSWLEQSINRAQILADGMKIYIPAIGEVSETQAGSQLSPQAGAVIGLEASNKVNVNTASLSELDSLWGIGEKRATAIIENRPYFDLSELVTKAGIPKNVFERIKDEIAL